MPIAKEMIHQVAELERAISRGYDPSDIAHDFDTISKFAVANNVYDGTFDIDESLDTAWSNAFDNLNL